MAETAEQLQQKLQAAQSEIEALKTKIAAMQTQVEHAQAKHELPATRPMEQALNIQHPIISSYELATYSQMDKASVTNLTRGKVVSVTGSIQRFSEGLGRGFSVFLDTNGSPMQIAGNFNSGSSVKSTFTAEEGSEMIVDDERRGRFTFAAINDKVVLSGWLEKVGSRRVSLVNCVLQKQ